MELVFAILLLFICISRFRCCCRGCVAEESGAGLSLRDLLLRVVVVEVSDVIVEFVAVAKRCRSCHCCDDVEFVVVSPLLSSLYCHDSVVE